MDTIKTKQCNTKLIAHRGLSGIERENTIAAFVAAGNRSYYGIETDVHVTADGTFVVIHDSETGRVADTNLCVEESTFAQLQQIKINDITGSGKAPRLDLRIPTLADYIDICRKYDKIAVLEVKTPFSDDALQRMVALIKEHEYLHKTVFISFFWDNLVKLREMLPDQPLQFLNGDCPPELIERLVAHRIDLDVGFWSLTAELVTELHNRGIVVNCWTCDDPDEYRKLAEYGVDFVTSNILE